MRPTSTCRNIDEYLEYFASSLSTNLPEGGKSILDQMLSEAQNDPWSVYQYVVAKKSTLASHDAELEQALTDFFWLFCY